MKAYTIRMDDSLLEQLKLKAVQEKTTIRQLVLDGINEIMKKKKKKKILTSSESKRMSELCSRVSTEQVVQWIREDRDR